MFKSKKQVEEYFSGSEIECLICHKTFKSIAGRHLSEKHGLTSRQYKDIYGLPLSRGLTSDETRKKKRILMCNRHERKDPTLNPLTPELMYKAHHSPKKTGAKRQSFTTELIKRNITTAAELKKIRSRERINKIDWNAFLNELESSNVAHWGLRENKIIPSWYSVKRKMDNDLNFKKRYKDITENIKLKNRYRDMILQMTSEGLSQRRISAIIGVSKSHIGRIRREQ
jgi:predicted XRE-type DNA-binding protein